MYDGKLEKQEIYKLTKPEKMQDIFMLSDGVFEFMWMFMTHFWLIFKWSD